MSRRITVPKAVHDQIVARALHGIDGRATVYHDENNTVSFPLSDEVLERLETDFPGVPIATAIELLLNTKQ